MVETRCEGRRLGGRLFAAFFRLISPRYAGIGQQLKRFNADAQQASIGTDAELGRRPRVGNYELHFDGVHQERVGRDSYSLGSREIEPAAPGSDRTISNSTRDGQLVMSGDNKCAIFEDSVYRPPSSGIDGQAQPGSACNGPGSPLFRLSPSPLKKRNPVARGSERDGFARAVTCSSIDLIDCGCGSILDFGNERCHQSDGVGNIGQSDIITIDHELDPPLAKCG